MTKKSFFISFCERSGSTFLVNMLNSHPEVCCEGEVFHIATIQNEPHRLPKFASRDAVRSELARIYSQDCNASGFKFKYPAHYKLYPDVFEYFLENSDTMHVIYLYRENLLKAAISKQNQLRLLAMDKPNNLNSKNYVELEKINLDIDQAVQYISWRENEDKNYHARLSDFKNVYILTYEILSRNTEKIMKEIYSFLDVDLNHEPTARTLKITKDSIQDAVKNYEELVKKLQNTEQEKYLYI